MRPPRPVTVIRIVIGLAGAAGLGYGLFLALTTFRSWPDVIATALWFGLPPIVFDLLLVPLIGLLGTLVAARASRPWKAPVIVGMIISGALLVIAAPFVSGIGRRADNPSLLDRPYLLGTAIALAAIWSGIGVWGGVRTKAQPRRGS